MSASEATLVKFKAARSTVPELTAEIERITNSLPKTQSKSARKRYESRLAIYREELASRKVES